jgi:SPP1 gp7 family putative phage head morphogenesis protein
MPSPLASFTVQRARPRTKRPLQPDGQRMFYFAQLRPMLARMHALVTSELLPLLERALPERRDRSELQTGPGEVSAIRSYDLGMWTAPGWDRVRATAERLRVDAAEDQIKAVLDRITLQLAREFPPRKFRTLAEQVFERTSEFQRAQLSQQVKAAVGLDPLIADRNLEEIAAAFVRENVALIKTISERYFSEVEDITLDAVRSGRRASDVSKEIEERYGISERNARRIANDQVGKAFGDLNKERMTELGVTRYTWRTVKDNRVRDSHDDLDGEVFEWDEPPTDSETGEEVIPGSPVNCRCWAEPVLDDLLG